MFVFSWTFYVHNIRQECRIFRDISMKLIRKMDGFNFEHINEDQLMNLVKRVKREKRRKRENDEWASFLSQKKEKGFSPLTNIDKVLLKTNEISHANSINIPIEISNFGESANPSEGIKHSHVQLSPRENISVSNCRYSERVSSQFRKIQNLRHKLSRNLDALIMQNEEDVLKEKLFKDTLNRFKETERNWKKVMNCQYVILKQDYQLVMDMRKLSLYATGHDIMSLLKYLFECHSTASKILQVFIHGLPDILQMDKSKEKLYDLLKCIITLTRICKFIGVNYGDVINMDDFLVDDVNKKSKYIIREMKKRILKGTQEKLNKMRTHGKLNMNENVYRHTLIEFPSSSAQNIPFDTIYIPIKRFKKLAKKVVGDIGSSEKTIKTSTSVTAKDCNLVRPTKTCREKYKIEETKDDHNSVHKSSKRDKQSNVDSKERSQLIPAENCVSVGTQHSLSFEKMEIFDVEVFSKRLYSAFETEIHNNFHDIFGNLKVIQPVFKNGETDVQNEEGQVVYNKGSINSLEIVQEPLQTIESEEKYEDERNQKRHMESLKLETKSLKEEEVIEKKNMEIGTLKVEQEMHARVNNSQNKDKSQLNDSNSSLAEDHQNQFSRIRINDTPSPVPETWDIIGRISDQLIDECLNSISCEVDNFIVQKMFDLEFN